MFIFHHARQTPAAWAELHKPETVQELVPESKWIEANGVKLHYIQAGEGPDVVLLHGIGASLFIWRLLFPLLQKRHRVTAIDIPGFGRSGKDVGRDYGLDAQTDVLIAALQAIGIEKADLVGSSMGGAISLWMAKRRPDSFEKVAVLAPATDATLVNPFVHKLAPIAPMFRMTMNRSTMRRILKQVIMRQELITEAVVDRYLEPFLDGGASLRTFVSATSLLADKRLPSQLSEVRSKVLVLYGEQDRSVPRKSIDRLMTILPSAMLATHAEAGHHIMEDEPVWVEKQLETFFAQEKS